MSLTYEPSSEPLHILSTLEHCVVPAHAPEAMRICPERGEADSEDQTSLTAGVDAPASEEGGG